MAAEVPTFWTTILLLRPSTLRAKYGRSASRALDAGIPL